MSIPESLKFNKERLINARNEAESFQLRAENIVRVSKYRVFLEKIMKKFRK